MKKSTLLPLLSGLIMIAVFATLASSTYADNSTPQGGSSTGSYMHKQSGVSGTVTAISGSTITVQGKNSTSYTVDATNAKVSKITASATAGTKPTITSITLADIKIGDTLRVQGTVSGTSVTATQITDGTFMGNWGGNGTMGNPVVSGTVTAISGSTITVQGKNSTSYTVDATNAKVSKITASATAGTKPTITSIALADIKIGDTLRVQGTVSGTTVTATQIIDGAFMGSLGGREMGNGKGFDVKDKGGNIPAITTSSSAASKDCLKTEKTTNAANVKSAKTDYNTAVKSTKGTYNAATKDAKTTYNAAVKSAKDTYNATVKDAKTTYNAAVTAAKAEDATAYAATVKDAKTTYNAAVKTAKNAYTAAVKAAKDTYNAATKDAKTTYNAELKSEKDTYNTALSTEKTRDTSAKTDCKSK